MSNRTMKHGLVVAVAGRSFSARSRPSWSAPMLSSTAAVKAAAPSAVIDVRNRNRGQYGNNGAIVTMARFATGARVRALPWGSGRRRRAGRRLRLSTKFVRSGLLSASDTAGGLRIRLRRLRQRTGELRLLQQPQLRLLQQSLRVIIGSFLIKQARARRSGLFAGAPAEARLTRRDVRVPLTGHSLIQSPGR